MKIIFAGTPEFAVPCLQALIDSPHEVIAVYSQPDRPAGRGRKLTASPVKQCALNNNIPVLQPETLKSVHDQEALAGLQADLMVVVAYGLILPETILHTPRLGCVNVHASLLPRWRGAAPIQRAIQAGDTETGVTLMQMDAGLDTGDMLLEIHSPIEANETGGSLHDKLALLGASLLTEGVEALAHGHVKAVPQPVEGVTYAHKLTKAEAQVDWSDSAEDISRQIRAFNPWPVSFTRLGEETIRLWNATVLNTPSDAKVGHILRANAEGIDVACGSKCLRITRLQWPGGRPVTAEQATNGRNLVGQQFSQVAR